MTLPTTESDVNHFRLLLPLLLKSPWKRSPKKKYKGPIFLSATEISGPFWGGDAVNPYRQFLARHPTSSIADSILVFDGRFDMSLAAALPHENLARQFVAREQLDEALAEADQAIAIAPNTFMAHAVRGIVLAKMKKDAEAQGEFQKAQALANAADSER